MTTTELIGYIAGGIVLFSSIPYIIRVYQGKIKPNFVTWAIWTVMALAFLLTYKSSGASSNIWTTVFGFTNPLIITILIWRKQGKIEKPSLLEISCIVISLISLTLWAIFRNNPELVQYALYLSLTGDAIAIVPTIPMLWKEPLLDRPFAWAAFGLGSGLNIFAIEEHTIANYSHPIYMLVGAFMVTTPLVAYRIKNRIPLKEWI